MSLLVYKFSDYEHTAEREQFRTVCKSLKTLFCDNEKMCLFIANYNIFDCELDGIIIKNDAIISVEFKNYGGTVTAVENGDWKLHDGTIIKGGSRKSVYQQAKLNHVALKRGFEDGKIVENSCLKNVAALVVFNQEIKLDNKLSSKTQSWLHITDNAHFHEKVEDITSRYTNLTNEDILKLIDKLNLDDEYRCDEFCFIDSETNSGEDITPVDSAPDKIVSIVASHQADDNALCIKAMIESILCEISLDNVIVNAYNKSFVESLFKDYGIELSKEYVITLDSQNMEMLIADSMVSKCLQINRVGTLIYLEFDAEDMDSLNHIISILRSKNLTVSKVKHILPDWLDTFIYEDLKGIYCKTNKDMIVIDWGKDDVLMYLGTYFPRSYTEAYCIVSQYLEVANIYENKEKISLFDFGCGTGGEIIGSITAIIEKNPNLQHIHILALDGNYFALRTFEKILKKFCTKSSVLITYDVIPLEIDDFYDMGILDSIINQKFDLVMSFKAICEFVTKQRFEEDNAYAHIAKFFLPRMNEFGVLLLADVTSYNDVSQEWLPHMMDNGLANAECMVVAKNSGYNQAFYVSHSRKKNDISKIAWRLILKN